MRRFFRGFGKAAKDGEGEAARIGMEAAEVEPLSGRLLPSHEYAGKEFPRERLPAEFREKGLWFKRSAAHADRAPVSPGRSWNRLVEVALGDRVAGVRARRRTTGRIAAAVVAAGVARAGEDLELGEIKLPDCAAAPRAKRWHKRRDVRGSGMTRRGRNRA